MVDDICMCVSEVVRGSDLLLSTARQILLHRALKNGIKREREGVKGENEEIKRESIVINGENEEIKREREGVKREVEEEYKNWDSNKDRNKIRN